MSEPEIIPPVPLPALIPAQSIKGSQHPKFQANKWKKGQSGNLKGRSAAYGEAMRICREASPDAARKMVELMNSDDHRVAYMATNAILERAWGKPREYDPSADPESKIKLNTDSLSKDQRDQLRALIQAAVAQPINSEA